MSAEALHGLFFSASGRTELKGPVEIPIDAALVVAHTRTTVLSDDPIEDGSSVTNHAVKAPPRVTITGVISDHPIAMFGVLGQAVDAARIAASGGNPASVLSGEVGDLLGNERASKSAFDLLDKAWDDRALLQVVTEFTTYDDMMIVDLQVDTSVDTGEALQFSATLRHVRFVTLGTTTLFEDLVDVATGSADRGASTQDRGRQPGTAASSSEQSSMRSAA